MSMDYQVAVGAIVKRRKTKRDEDHLQRAICGLLKHLEAQGRLFWFAVPNGGYRKRAEARILKGLGVRAGVPDLCIIIQGRCHFMEVKTPSGTLSKSQKETIPLIERNGAPVAIVRSVDDAVLALKKWGIIQRGGSAHGWKCKQSDFGW